MLRILLIFQRAATSSLSKNANHFPCNFLFKP
jgi:hypothetical protein